MQKMTKFHAAVVTLAIMTGFSAYKGLTEQSSGAAARGAVSAAFGGAVMTITFQKLGIIDED